MTRVTLAVPAEFMEACNHTMVMLGKAGALNTYTSERYQDAGGNLYAVSSGLWTDNQILGVTDPDVLQGIVDAGEVPDIVDVYLVMEAGAAFTLWYPDDPGFPPLASPSAIVGLVGEGPIALIEAMGLTVIEV
jgi:hypothetical protein